MSGETTITIDYEDPVLPGRFWAKVYPCPITGCWLWGAATHEHGYGIWRVGGRNERAHVSAFRAAGGVVTPDRPNVLHSCDTPPCLRPEHLRGGSQAENIDDLVARGRYNHGRSAKLTPALAREIRAAYAAGGWTQRQLARKYGITQPAVSMIVNDHRWAA